MAECRGIVGRWMDGHAGVLDWLPPQAGAFCCMRLVPGRFGPRELDRFHAYLTRERTQIAPGTWFGDSAHVFRLGLAYEPVDKLAKGLDIISAALADALDT
jgi:hypothetical protein